ncbi:alpha-1,3-mannosyl-glycoprotein 2-beta-N-acetylglucosaminyltransferase b isoform X1 [Fundulus heteroclitus]|uniref:alpha-1,3-mannosyl-glycoprotein 2-beta-N-acetylglucosaminyltransferase b isoform X1 n=1 Tax=Fundulus heteroclitus TaxID=8078 RepID=UPI00165BAC39|nr:alpha-1,3-mannosyl-glycoprotein 2-beta-N-acetylglucosaminyltransferase b isoform X1 [Fundulus heteroclitus]
MKTRPTRKSDRAPLQPLPVVSTPFRKVAMDIVGPLVKSGCGHQYILVVCDYATRFPEAFPLHTITAPVVVRALVQLFSRVGIPDQILTDQGTNFTSNLLKLFHKQLGISAIRTTPYHPQTDGLIERFNQTLKRMLQKFVNDTGRDWDRWLPFLLFAYREVPQASTGFSPFELLYGWDVQGPLDLLRKSWDASETSSNAKGVVQYVLQMRGRLAEYQKEAENNLLQAQQKQKRWYDQQARQRVLSPGQKVLLLLPSSTSKLLAKWQGPYTISRQLGPTTYEVYHPDKKKATQAYHVNLLKEWKEPWPAPETSCVLRPVEEEDEVPGIEVMAEQSTPNLSHLSLHQASQLQQIFQKLSSLFSPNPGRTTLIEHAIRLKEKQPIRQRPYRVPQQLVGQLRDEVETMLTSGIIEPSNSEWCSPVVIVCKKDGSLRICNDFRKLNAVSEFDAYPMPRVDELLERIGKAKFITTLDLCKGYWQVPLEPSSRQYTAFRTPSGLFQFTVMPFGLHGPPATFQWLMDKVLRGSEDYSAAYLDDVIIYSNSWEEHVSHLARVLEKIGEAGLTLNILKCVWAQQETRYLGYHLGRGKVRPQMDKIEAIQKCPRPRTKKEVRSFLGLAGWYRRFVPHFATLASPLTSLTAKDQKNPVVWSKECEASFNTLKAHLCSSPVLRSPDFSKKFLVQVDASTFGLGAVLAQGDPGEEQPILYLSRKLLPQEVRYSVVEKEGLAIKWALESLKYYLLGREFDLETDHRALTWINTMKDHNHRLTRWYLSLQP